MRGPSLAALGLAAYGVFLVATLPAAYVASQVQSAFPGRVELGDAQGTLWRGSARARIGAQSIDRLDWRFLPSRLAAGEIAFRVDLAAPALRASLDTARGVSLWRLRDVKANGDATTLATLVPWLAAWRPSGPLVISAPEIVVEGREVRGTLEVEWRGASVGLSEVRPLGTYRAAWRGEKGGGTIDVTTLAGPLRIAGHAKTTPALRFAFSGEARAEGEAAKALEPLLDLMGPRRADGARAIELRLD